MRARFVLAGFGLVGFAGCGAADRPPERAWAPTAAPTCARRSNAALPKPLALHGAAGTVALARSDQLRVAYVADEDSRALHAVDLDAGRMLGSTPLGAAPSSVVVLADGRVAVALRDDN